MQVGDYVILHVGYALSKLDPEEAARTLALFAELPKAPARDAGQARMKYIDEFRDGALARNLAASIAAEADPGRRYNLMEFCGGHTHAISRYGVGRPAAGAGAHDPRPRLPGVRAADRPRRPGDPAGAASAA